MTALLVVTRSDPRDDRIVEAAQGCSFRVARLPLLGTEPGRDMAGWVDWLEHPREGSAIAWTSRRAAVALADAALPRFQDVLARLPLFAVGAESAAPITDRHLDVTFVGSEPSATRLAALITEARAARDIRRVAFLHGDRSLPDLPAALERAGIAVDPFEVYRTSFLAPDVDVVRSALAADDPVVIFYYSPSGIEALERLLPPDALGSLRARARAVPIGDTTRRALEARGYAGIAEAGIDPFTPTALPSVKRIPL